MRFLIDECLHTSLVETANAAGYEAQHVIYCGLRGCADHQIIRHALAQDFVVVTNNAADFRRLYEQQGLHPGLVIILPVVPPGTQRLLFDATLRRLKNYEPLNTIVEATITGGVPTITLYRWPPSH